MYGAKCWATKKSNVNKLSVAKMKMLRDEWLFDSLTCFLNPNCQHITSEYSLIQCGLVFILHVQAANIEVEAPGLHESQYHLTKHEYPSLGHGKYREWSTTESSDDIEKQELEELSDEVETHFFDTKDSFSDSAFGYRSITGVLDVVDKCSTHSDAVDRMHVVAEFTNCSYPHIERRKKLPDPVEQEKGVSLWSMIKDNVGKDLTRVCLPVYFNEPISSLQKCCEDLEYSYLLDRAFDYGKKGNSLLRVLNVAAFAVSGYASSDGRHCKPFNPLLGETYEAEYPDKAIRFFSEKVSVQ
ncbi:oxysterol-binding protein-related protein 2B-like [Macadamia integrifolia]|uniref:oxysterol-binding protein-related protein 2B-like n=1 Tax=Macadamia integrifolia TaxID=60698 RepID=UPI001C4E5B51|nr:oxysterol-binding protein-related protein 2B-like [Macadamia integrifolia]